MTFSDETFLSDNSFELQIVMCINDLFPQVTVVYFRVWNHHGLLKFSSLIEGHWVVSHLGV